MPLHDNLERKRRENIAELNASGVCHLCKTTSGSRSYRSFVGNDDDDNETTNNNIINKDDNVSNNHQDLPQSPLAVANNRLMLATSSSEEEDAPPVPMRTCMCYGNSKSWPYGLKVCEVCIKDDVNSCTGRIRHCGICGVIACDENCGTELVECTDKEEWEQRGCLECRGLEGFNELELFRKRPYPSRDEDGKELPRATRVCMECIELFSLYSSGKKYQFACRYFKCNNLLVPSNLVELKRSLTPFPLSELPTEILDVTVDFLGARDLLRIGSVCSSLFKKVESVSKDIVTRFNHQLPSGPTVIMRSDKKHIKQKMVFAEGKNRHGLSSPADGKTWVGVLCQMEELTREIFYFDFQIKSDDGAAMRFLRNSDKLSFDRIFAKTAGINAPLIPYVDTGGLQVKGGQVLVTRYKWHHTSLIEPDEVRENRIRQVIFSTDKILNTGIHRVIIRYYCFCEGDALGSIGLLRQQEDGSGVAWQNTISIICQGRMEEHVFGMEYDADARNLKIFKKNGRTNKMEATSTRWQQVRNDGGNICFAAALASGSVGLKGNQLSIRSCTEKDWKEFLNHTAEKNVIPRTRGRSRRGEERLMRYLDHRARRANIDDVNDGDNNNNNDADIADRVEIEQMMDMLVQQQNAEMAAESSDDSSSSSEESDDEEMGR